RREDPAAGGLGGPRAPRAGAPGESPRQEAPGRVRDLAQRERGGEGARPRPGGRGGLRREPRSGCRSRGGPAGGQRRSPSTAAGAVSRKVSLGKFCFVQERAQSLRKSTTTRPSRS